MNFLTLKPEAFGLDISDLSLKIVQLKRRGRTLALASFGQTAVKPGIIDKGEIKDTKALAEIIKKALKEAGGERIKTKYVIASLPEEKAFLQVIPMPRMKEEELKKAVYFEAENYVPLPIDQVYLDCQVIQPVHNHLDHLDVLIAAQPRNIVDPYVITLKEAGLQPKALEIESQAIARALIKNGVSPWPLLLIDLGAIRTSLIVFSGYSLRFTTTLTISSQGMSELISKTLAVDLIQAEKLKLRYGLDRGKKHSVSSKVFDALIPILTDLTEQVKRYLDYYQSHASHEHLPANGKIVEKIYLCGGGTNLKGLAPFLSYHLKIPAERGNPWINILPPPLKEVQELPYEKSVGYTTALGLALRGIQKND